MYKQQRILTEKLLFDYYLISSCREDDVFSRFPCFLDRKEFEQMTDSGLVIDGIVRRITEKYLENPDKPLFPIGDFPLTKNVFALKKPFPGFFWTRYDIYLRGGNGIFYTEFNYDKPCAQREILFSEDFNPPGNPNRGFRETFKAGFDQIVAQRIREDEKLSIAVLVDPNHYEEHHLAFIYFDILKDPRYEFIVSGAKNFHVENDIVYAFDRKIDVILRQYPTEFLQEVNDIEKILDLYDQDKILFINDPRAIVGQAKSLFAYLWKLADENDPFLTQKEKHVIKTVIPRTEMYSPEKNPELIESKDKYVIKAVFGRYSEEVYIGWHHTPEEWLETIKYVEESPKLHIIQEYCRKRNELNLAFYNGRYIDTPSDVNYGLYLTCGNYGGVCARLSDDDLTADETVWLSTVGLREKSLEAVSLEPDDESERNRIWEDINEEAAFEWGYTGGFTGKWEHFLLHALILDKQQYAELEEASSKVIAIFKKTSRLVAEKSGLLCPVLGISPGLQDLVCRIITDEFTFIGRLDWVYDTAGNLKLLEFNSETPAGIMESIALNSLIHKKLGRGYANPNSGLMSKISSVFDKIMSDFEENGEIKTIGMVSGIYYEDLYNTEIIGKALAGKPYRFIQAEISALEPKNGKIYLYGEPVDAFYRYYPLDWFENDKYFEGVTDAMKSGTLSINPPSTFISQGKTFFALLWELAEQGFFSEEENNIIRRYIPVTGLSPEKTGTDDFILKPYFGREGQGILMNYQCSEPAENCDYIYQERIDVQQLRLPIRTTTGKTTESAFPVIGMYITGDKPAGIFTRAGGRITDKWSVFLPSFLKV
ncbi:MAG: glutathionylspermidine synthase family protein [Firmicutes bacterium]|nr:glutathionylspermidine synthase family protein [Bacillota bacterium]